MPFLFSIHLLYSSWHHAHASFWDRHLSNTLLLPLGLQTPVTMPSAHSHSSFPHIIDTTHIFLSSTPRDVGLVAFFFLDKTPREKSPIHKERNVLIHRDTLDFTNNWSNATKDCLYFVLENFVFIVFVEVFIPLSFLLRYFFKKKLFISL